MRRDSTAFLFLCALCAVAPPSWAAVCQVPSGAHPTIQSAVDDAGCTEIELAEHTFVESVTIPRDIIIRGASTQSTVIAGQVVAEGVNTEVVLQDVTVDASTQGVGGMFPTGLHASAGAEVSPSNVVVRNSLMDLWTLFVDGFESGDTSAWSATQP